MDKINEYGKEYGKTKFKFGDIHLNYNILFWAIFFSHYMNRSF